MSIENPFQEDILPEKLFILMKNQAALNGSITQNPHNFKNYDVSSIRCYIDGNQLSAINTDFSTNNYYEAYLSTLAVIGNTDHKYSPTDFADRFCVFAFNIVPDNNASLTLLKKGSLRLSFTFRTALSHNLNIILLGLKPSSFIIDKYRKVRRGQ